MKKSKQSCDLNSCFMCKCVKGEWKQLLDLSRKHYVLKKGEQFITEGELMNGVYFVRSGVVKVHKSWLDKELIVRFASNGAIVGHRGIYSGNNERNIYPISATAIETSEVCFIDLPLFMSTLRINSEFTFDLMMFFAEELRQSEQRMRNLVHMTVKSRLALALFKLEDQFGVLEDGRIAINLSKQDLASFVGTTYETLFRMIIELGKEHLIEVEGKNIMIKNREGLNRKIETYQI